MSYKRVCKTCKNSTLIMKSPMPKIKTDFYHCDLIDETEYDSTKGVRCGTNTCERHEVKTDG